MAKKPKRPLLTEADTPEMHKAVEALKDHGALIARPSEYQLKIGPLNYWPGTGKITMDSGSKITARGLDSLLDMLPRRPHRIRLGDDD